MLYLTISAIREPPILPEIAVVPGSRQLAEIENTGGVENTGGIAAGGVSTGGMGTGGAPVGFQPCPEAEPCKILPLGDSITVGLGFDGGYRVELFHLALSDGHDITFTGTQPPNGPATVDGVTFPRNHEGISGETIEQIAGRIPSPGLNEMPHIVLLHAGTNDMWAGANGADTRLGSLLDELIADAPDALIVVSYIIPFSQAAGSVSTFNASVPGLVQERANAGAHIIFVDQFEGFPESELGDGVHPNQAGYARMAGKWYDAIESYLP
jgi:lysophospholipase L1-like esterase